MPQANSFSPVTGKPAGLLWFYVVSHARFCPEWFWFGMAPGTLATKGGKQISWSRWHRRRFGVRHWRVFFHMAGGET
jgi:hypothetical protein